MSPTPAIRRLPDERTRVLLTAVAGLVAGMIVALFEPWQLSVLVAWDVTVALFVSWVWLSIGRLDSAETARLALAEDDTRQGSRAPCCWARRWPAWSGWRWA